MLAYGLSVPALPPGGTPPPASVTLPWHDLDLRQRRGPGPARRDTQVGEEEAALLVPGLVELVVTRSPLTATVTAPEPFDVDALVHPVMSFVGGAVAPWHGRTAFHAGAVVLEGRAWVLLGRAGSGKSTLVSMLHASGLDALADDCVVVDGTTVLAGPPLADLRVGAAEALGRGRRLAADVGRPRWRESFDQAVPESPLAGFVELSWGAGPSIEPVEPSRRLGVLAANEAFPLAAQAKPLLLPLLPYPIWRLRRPADWSGSTAVTALMHQLAAGAD